jgi:hypothetical protein
VSLFLSDVETDAWPEGSLGAVANSTARTLVTLGDKGADEYLPGGTPPRRIPPVKVGRWACEEGRPHRRGDAAAGAEWLGCPGTDGSLEPALWRRPPPPPPSPPPPPPPAHQPPLLGCSPPSSPQATPPPPPPQITAVDTNGAGDTFATAYMIAALLGDEDPGATAAWAASRAVLQPQSCKPHCAPALIPGGRAAAVTAAARLRLSAAALLQRAGLSAAARTLSRQRGLQLAVDAGLAALGVRARSEA